MQGLDATSKFKNLLITNKVTTQFLNSLGFGIQRCSNSYIHVVVCTSISYLSFSCPIVFSRLKGETNRSAIFRASIT